MANLLQYTDKSKTIDAKLNIELAKIEYDYRNGNIRTETEYYYRIRNMLRDFYDTLTKPTFKYRPAVSTPISDEYNSMIQEAVNDMEYIVQDCENLDNLVTQSFSDAELSRSMLRNALLNIKQKIDNIGNSISTNQPIGTVVFTELFNSEISAENLGDADACSINSSDHILTLRYSSGVNVNINKAYIDPENSNGLPGNTHCADIYSSSLHYVGQEGLHNNIKTILDRTADTWYEFESFDISDTVRKHCNSYGFEYDEGISWINKDGILKMRLVLDLSSPETCSWVSIDPYLSDVKGAKAPLLEKCEVITTENNIYVVGSNINLDDTKVFPFPPHTIKRIIFTFVQTSKYQTKVGHYYYTLANTSDISAFQEYNDTDIFTRVDGKKPSVGLIGCKYDPTTKWVIYPNSDDKMPSEDYIRSELFCLPESTIEKKANEELIDAYRYLIAIKNIRLSSYTFAKHSEFVSRVYTTDEQITSVCIEADEYIPYGDPEIIKYFISLNGGVSWHQIHPTHRAYNGIYKYYVNSDSIDNQITPDRTTKRSKSLTVIGEPKQIQVKITMDRPVKDEEELPYSSPLLYGYRLKLTTGGDTIEY